MLKRMQILLKSSSFLLFVKGKSNPIAVATLPSSYSSIFREKVKNYPIQISDIVLTNQQCEIEEVQDPKIKHLKLFMNSQGKLEESQLFKEGNVILGQVSESIINREVVGMQTRFQYMLMCFVKISLIAFFFEMFVVIFKHTQIVKFEK